MSPFQGDFSAFIEGLSISSIQARQIEKIIKGASKKRPCCLTVKFLTSIP